jgi:hypothetical protein
LRDKQWQSAMAGIALPLIDVFLCRGDPTIAQTKRTIQQHKRFSLRTGPRKEKQAQLNIRARTPMT